MKSQKFDIIIYCESILQYNIIDKILVSLKDKKCLIITKDYYKFQNSNQNHIIKISTVDLHGFKKTLFFSNKNHLFSKKIYECGVFIASFLTGINSLFWESKISYKELHLIDDGTGTLYNIKYKRDYTSNTLRSIVNIFNIFNYILNKPKICYTNYTIQQKIAHYYTIYPLITSSFKSVTNVEIFNKISAKKPINAIAFIGQPFIKTGEITKEKMFKILETIYKVEKTKIIYFKHPYEQDYSNIYDIDIEFVRIPEGIEHHLTKYSYKKIITFQSSALLNLKNVLVIDDNILYFIRLITSNEVFNNYYTIFEDFGIQEYKLIN